MALMMTWDLWVSQDHLTWTTDEKSCWRMLCRCSNWLFFSSTDIPFPKTFIPICKKILSRLFRVFVHVYIHHFNTIKSLGVEAHVNTCYKHFYYFVTEFNLVPSKELEPLADLTMRLIPSAASSSSPIPGANGFSHNHHHHHQKGILK